MRPRSASAARTREALRDAVQIYAPSTVYAVGLGAMTPALAVAALALGLDAARAAAVVLLVGLGSLVANGPASALAARAGERVTMVVSAVLGTAGAGLAWATTAGVPSGPSAAGVAEPGRLALFLTAVLAVGMAGAGFNLARQAYLAVAVPATHRARAMSTLGGTVRIGTFLGPFLGAAAQADLLRRALIVLADHELNVSTFAARVTASSGASLHHATLAALCALQGPRHGLAALDAHDLISLARRDGPGPALRDATRRYSRPPGFGHALYPDGDPRALLLLRALEEADEHAALVQTAHDLMTAVRRETGEQINVDFALAALIHALGRPAGDTLTLFALARSVGWLGHATETLTSGQLIRPRARYVGPATPPPAP